MEAKSLLDENNTEGGKQESRNANNGSEKTTAFGDVSCVYFCDDVSMWRLQTLHFLKQEAPDNTSAYNLKEPRTLLVLS